MSFISEIIHESDLNAAKQCFKNAAKTGAPLTVVFWRQRRIVDAVPIKMPVTSLFISR